MTNTHNGTRAPHVVIVGGGPIGLSAALLLHRHGIRSTVLERDAGRSVHPKARGMRVRTMELFSQWGLAGAMYAEALPQEANRFIYCDSLTGEELGRSPEVDPDRGGVSRARTCRIPQDLAHRHLAEAVDAMDLVDVRMNAEVVAIRQEDDGVTVTTASGDSVRGDYVIAADGAGSTVRRMLGIGMEGKPVLGYGQSIYWHGDLSRWAADRPCVQFVTGNRTGFPSNIASVDGRERWITMIMQPAAEDRPTPPTPEEAVDIINRAVGADVSPQVLDIATWRISSQVASKWRDRRVFLAGDAAHSFPPTGGFGMNTGIQDAHNLVWKLAAVLHLQAGERLLDSYEQERIEIARSNAAWSEANGRRFREIGAAISAGDQQQFARLLDEQRAHVDATKQDLAFGYAEGALAGRDNLDVNPLKQARLGFRFPEADLLVRGALHSANTELGDVFILAVRDAEAWRTELVQGAAELTLAVAPAAVLGDASAALIRPDGFVGWLGMAGSTTDDVLSALHSILGADR